VLSGAAPFESFNVADIGDVAINTFNLPKCVDIITEYYQKVLRSGCVPITMGGDHTLTYPLLRAIAEKHGPVGLIQVDAHHDFENLMFGERIGHGTTFRRSIEDKLISPQHMVQIGLRGGTGGLDDMIDNYQWGMDQGVRMIPAEECWYRSLSPLMSEVREVMGDRPVYLTFDIDGIDPTHCPGTGTCEVGGLTPIQALEVVRGCRGLNLVGADLVEVNPLFDPTAATAVMGANLLFEMLCVLPGVKYYDFKLSSYDPNK
jgi:guanidinobutyrase